MWTCAGTSPIIGNMAQKSSLDYRHLAIQISIVIGTMAVLAGGYVGIQKARLHFAIKKAEKQVLSGYGALAARTMRSVENLATHTPAGCRILMNCYYAARRMEDLEWAAQACLDAGHEMPEPYVALTAVAESMNQDQKALNILEQALKRHSKSADLYYRVFLIMKRNKNFEQATLALTQATTLAPENGNLNLEALQFLVESRKWPEARQIAHRLAGVKTDNPAIKLLVARALIEGGDKASAEAVIAQAKELLAKNPQLKATLEKSYGDLLK